MVSERVKKEIARDARKRIAWAALRIPRALWQRLHDLGGASLHQTITDALDVREDPKAARRVSELRALVANLTARVLELERELGKGRGGPLAAAARTLPMFSILEVPPAVRAAANGPSGTGILRVMPKGEKR